MDNVLVCPASGPAPTIHFNATIENAVSLSSIAQYLEGADLALLSHIYPRRSLWMWGMRASNLSRWQQLDVDDEVIFYQSGFIVRRCRATHKTHNVALSDFLWKRDADNQSFEYVFFLTRPETIALPLREFNELIGVSATAPVQRTNIYQGDRAIKILNRLEAQSQTSTVSLPG